MGMFNDVVLYRPLPTAYVEQIYRERVALKQTLRMLNPYPKTKPNPEIHHLMGHSSQGEGVEKKTKKKRNRHRSVNQCTGGVFRRILFSF